MKTAKVIIAGSAMAALAAITPSWAQTSDPVLTAQEIKWSPGPASIPAGSQIVVLYGDPGKEGLFSLRLKLPMGYRIAPHTQVSGTGRLGMGTSGDPSKAKVLPAGSFFALTPGTQHYFSADEDTVIQLNSTGPWALNYVNPKDAPQKTQ